VWPLKYFWVDVSLPKTLWVCDLGCGEQGERVEEQRPSTSTTHKWGKVKKKPSCPTLQRPPLVMEGGINVLGVQGSDTKKDGTLATTSC